MEEKDFFFDIDLAHLYPMPEDWFFTIPVRLTIAEIEALRKAEKEWKQTDEWKNRYDDADDEYYIRKYCTTVHEKVRKTLEEYCKQHFTRARFHRSNSFPSVPGFPGRKPVSREYSFTAK